MPANLLRTARKVHKNLRRYLVGLLIVPLVGTAVIIGHAYGGAPLALIMCLAMLVSLAIVLLPQRNGE